MTYKGDSVLVFKIGGFCSKKTGILKDKKKVQSEETDMAGMLGLSDKELKLL